MTTRGWVCDGSVGDRAERRVQARTCKHLSAEPLSGTETDGHLRGPGPAPAGTRMRRSRSVVRRAGSVDPLSWIATATVRMTMSCRPASGAPGSAGTSCSWAQLAWGSHSGCSRRKHWLSRARSSSTCSCSGERCPGGGDKTWWPERAENGSTRASFRSSATQLRAGREPSQRRGVHGDENGSRLPLSPGNG